MDGYPTGTHRLETITGREPLEDGTEVTDHAVAQSAQLTLEGWVSDFNGGQRPRAAWDAIRELQKSKAAVTVITEIGLYHNMLIYRAETPQDIRGIRFSIELREIQRVGVVDSELPPSALTNEQEASSALDLTMAAQSAVPDASRATAAIEEVIAGSPLPASPSARAAIESARAAADGASAFDRIVRSQGITSPLTGGLQTAANTFLGNARNSLNFLNSLQLPGASRATSRASRLVFKAERASALVSDLTRAGVASTRTGAIQRGRVALGGFRGFGGGGG